jgi:hypothetical protein
MTAKELPDRFTHLKQIGTGRIYVRTAIKAKRKDMVPFDPKNPGAIPPGFEGAQVDPVTALAKLMASYTKDEVLMALDRVYGSQLYGQQDPASDAYAPEVSTPVPDESPKSLSDIASEIVVDDDDPLWKKTRKEIAEDAKENLDPGLVIDITKDKTSVIAEYRAAEMKINAIRNGAV